MWIISMFATHIDSFQNQLDGVWQKKKKKVISTVAVQCDLHQEIFD